MTKKTKKKAVSLNEQSVEEQRERKRKIMEDAGLPRDKISDEILDMLEIVKEPFHRR